MPAMKGKQWRVNYRCLVTKISSDHSQKSVKTPELFERHLNNTSINTVGRGATFINTLESFVGKKLDWQSAYCTVQTSYGL